MSGDSRTGVQGPHCGRPERSEGLARPQHPKAPSHIRTEPGAHPCPNPLLRLPILDLGERSRPTSCKTTLERVEQNPRMTGLTTPAEAGDRTTRDQIRKPHRQARLLRHRTSDERVPRLTTMAH